MQKPTLNELAAMVHENAKNKGFHDFGESDDQFVERTCNLIHDEVSELHEAWRNGELKCECDKGGKMLTAGIKPLTNLEEELADIIIRALDSAQRLGVDIESAVIRKHQFNLTRPYRHGGKRS